MSYEHDSQLQSPKIETQHPVFNLENMFVDHVLLLDELIGDSICSNEGDSSRFEPLAKALQDDLDTLPSRNLEKGHEVLHALGRSAVVQNHMGAAISLGALIRVEQELDTGDAWQSTELLIELYRSQNRNVSGCAGLTMNDAVKWLRADLRALIVAEDPEFGHNRSR